MAPSSPLRAVLRAAQVARVLAASTVGRIPLGAAPVALLLYARETLSIAAAGLLVGVYTAGLAIGGPVLARVADRLRQPPVMLAGAAVSTAGFVLLAQGVPLWASLLAALLAGLGAPPFEAGLRVLWRDLLDEAQVPTAYTLDIAVQELIFVFGPLIAGVSVALGGPAAGVYMTALMQLLGTVWFVTTPVVRRWRGVAAERHWAGALRSPLLGLLLVAVVLVGAGVGSLPVAVIDYTEQSGGQAPASLLTSWILAAQAAGAFAGGLANTRLRVDGRRLPLLAALLGLGYVPLLLTPAPAVWMIPLAALCGVCLPPFLAATFLTVDRVAPQGTAAEAFAWVATAFSVGAALGAALNGVIVDAAGARWAGFALSPLVILLAVPWVRPVARATT
ncbi:MFS transporter [Dactylosporangium sp. AC04546]|uniref:MFS transporter n=1 Tax=Dactylosporangium sp. AC04546 TaxID=2862460 RepID=UPI001EDCEC53|nr:MFS transporter [Dactylosporangium sp. AC04546]WVK86033.1 MFS transporter [Dactylosporangium sp. AC04546]